MAYPYEENKDGETFLMNPPPDSDDMKHLGECIELDDKFFTSTGTVKLNSEDLTDVVVREKSEYFKKIDVVVNLIETMYTNGAFDFNPFLIYVDGGELTGTSTLIKNFKNYFQEGTVCFTKEPTPESKRLILERFGDNSLFTNPSDKIEGITDCFMEDRKANQVKFKDKLTISDRGIFSTFIYQSGILDPETSIEDIEKNCQVIYLSALKHEIELPILAINLCNVELSDVEEISDEFKRRLEKRISNSEQEVDNLDNLDIAMNINNCYTDISRELFKKIGSNNFTCIDFKYPEESILCQAVKSIDNIQFYTE